MTDNPFGKWTHLRARIAAMSRSDADDSGLQETRQLLLAARLSDRIVADRDLLTSEQRRILAEMMQP